MAGGSRSENLAAHTLQEFLGVSSLPNFKGKAPWGRVCSLPGSQSFICVIIVISTRARFTPAKKKESTLLNKKRARADCRFKLTRQRL